MPEIRSAGLVKSAGRRSNFDGSPRLQDETRNPDKSATARLARPECPIDFIFRNSRKSKFYRNCSFLLNAGGGSYARILSMPDRTRSPKPPSVGIPHLDLTP